MLEMFATANHNIKALRDKERSDKEEQKGTEEDEQREVEDNGTVEDDSSSERGMVDEQHNNTSISPQPLSDSKKQIVSFSNLPSAAITTNGHEEAHDVNMEEADSMMMNEYITDTVKTIRAIRRKKKNKVIRSSSSDRLMITDQALPTNTSRKPLALSEDGQESALIMEVDRNCDITSKHNNNNNGGNGNSSHHRKTRSLPGMHVHLHSMLNRLDGENRTALSHACEKGQKEVIEFLLGEQGIAIEEGGKHHEESWTNLHWACRYGHHEIVQLLLNKGANINAQTSKKSMFCVSILRHRVLSCDFAIFVILQLTLSICVAA